MDLTAKKILDVTCGYRCLWYDKNNEYTIYTDARTVEKCMINDRVFEVQPDMICDFRDLPFPDSSFKVVIFDPPHWTRIGHSWVGQKYGGLPDDWQVYLEQGFRECFRVLEPFGVLCFKWSDGQIPFADVIKLAPEPPLFGNRGKTKTKWTMFVKGAGKLGTEIDLFEGE